MHELSLAAALVEQAEKALAEHPAGRVRLVRLRLGALSGVDRDAFEFAFPLAAEGSRLEGAELAIAEDPAVVACEDCRRNSEPDILFVRCAHCGSDRVRIVSGRDFLLESIELD